MVENTTASVAWDSLPSYISYCIQGLTISVANLVIVICILRYEALRSAKEFLLIMASSLADALNMMAFLAAGIYRTYLLIKGYHDDLVTPWDCAKTVHGILWSFSTHLATSMLAVVSLDRLLCVSFPLRYLGWSRTYSLSLIGSVYLYCISSGIIGEMMVYDTRNDPPSLQARCITLHVLLNTNTTNTAYAFHYGTAPSAYAFLSIILYALVGIEYKRKSAKVSDQNVNQAEQLKHQSKFTKSLGISCMCTFVLFVIPYSSANIAYNFFKWRHLPLVFWSISNFNPMCNVFIYFVRHKEIRQAAKGFITGKQMPIDIRMWKANVQASSHHGSHKV